MKMKDRALVLKNGEKLLMRTPDKRDAASMLAFLGQTYRETDYMGGCPEDRMISEAQEAELLRRYRDSARDLNVTVFDGSKVIASAGIYSLSERKKLCHRAGLGIAILREYWGQGIGTALVKECLEQARSMGYEQVELEAVDANETAVELYRKLGFSECGKIPHAQRLSDGRYQDYCMMVCFLTGKNTVKNTQAR